MVDMKRSEVSGKKSKHNEVHVDDLLSGMKSICNYIHRTEPTVLAYIKSQAFPAKKVGGIWESRKGIIDQWRDGVEF